MALESADLKNFWINTAEKIVSFQKIDGWSEFSFPSKEEALCCLDDLIMRNFRFQ